jgi:hypothetical protein
MELKTTSKHESPSYLVFRLFHCCAANATSSHSSTYIYDQESRSLEPSSSTILHRKRVNMVFGKRSLRLFAHFFKFFITAHIPFRRTCAEGYRLQRKLCQADRRRQRTASHIWFILSNHVLSIVYVDLRMYDFARQFIIIFIVHCYDRSI